MIRRAGLVLLVLLGSAGPIGAEDEPAPARTRHAGPKDIHSLTVPSTWKVGGEWSWKGACIGLWFTTPGHEERLGIRLYNLNGLVEPLAQAYTEQPGIEKDYEQAVVRVHRDPHGYVEADYVADDRKMHKTHHFRLIRGNGFTLHSQCEASLWPHVKDEVLRIYDSIETKAEEWPRIPKGYESVEKHGFRYYLHPDARRKDVDAYHRFLRKQQKSFVKRHGPIDPEAMKKATILFHGQKRQAASFWKEAADHANGQVTQILEQRLFAVPLKRSDRVARGSAAYAIWILLFRMRYGSALPDWLFAGEAFVALGEAEAGKPLPYATPWVKEQSADVPLLSELLDIQPPKRQPCALYVAVFVDGPRVYRQAFKSFLEEYGRTGDWCTAEKTHLLPLDQDKLARVAVDYLHKKMKTVDE